MAPNHILYQEEISNFLKIYFSIPYILIDVVKGEFVFSASLIYTPSLEMWTNRTIKMAPPQ